MFLNCWCQCTIKQCLNALLIPMTAEATSSVVHWPIEEALYFIYFCTYVIHVREEMSHPQDFEIHWIKIKSQSWHFWRTLVHFGISEFIGKFSYSLNSLPTLLFTNISSFSFPLPVEFLSFLSFNVWGLELILIKNKAEARESFEMFHSYHPFPLHWDCPQRDFLLATSLPSSPSSSNMCRWQQHDGSQDGRFYSVQLMPRGSPTLSKYVIKTFILISTGIPLQLSPRL